MVGRLPQSQFPSGSIYEAGDAVDHGGQNASEMAGGASAPSDVRRSREQTWVRLMPARLHLYVDATAS